MTNHPSRGWRKRAAHEAALWLAVWWPPGATSVVSEMEQALRKDCIEAYLAGYSAGRESTRPNIPHHEPQEQQ